MATAGHDSTGWGELHHRLGRLLENVPHGLRSGAAPKDESEHQWLGRAFAAVKERKYVLDKRDKGRPNG